MDEKTAKKIIQEQIRKDRTFDGHFDFFDWLYDNGYEIIKPDPPKSKFMEEWGKLYRKMINEGRSEGHPTEYIMGLAELIDKHKADKEG